MLTEKIVNTDTYAGTVDLITGIEDFESQVEYNSEWHTYKLNGKIIPSVTQLLDDGSYIDVDPTILKYAQDKGTIVHKEIENYLNKGTMGFTSEFYEFLRLYNENRELFETEAIWDYKTYAVATPKNREKCYKQETMYAGGIKYLTGKEIKNKYMIWLPHNKKGKIIDLRKEFEK